MRYRDQISFYIVFIIYTYFINYMIFDYISKFNKIFINGLDLYYSPDVYLKSYLLIVSSTIIFSIGCYCSSFFKYEKINININFIVKLFHIYILLLITSFIIFIMFLMKIGISIYTDHDYYPFKIVGILIYLRLLLPFFISYLLIKYKKNLNFKNYLIVLIFLISIYIEVMIFSGSRYISIIYSLPILVLIEKRKILFFIALLLISITISTLTRAFFLPYYLGDLYVFAYASPDGQHFFQNNFFYIPFLYLNERISGFNTLMRVLYYYNGYDDFLNSALSLLKKILQIGYEKNVISSKFIFNRNDNDVGGLGLDFYSNFLLESNYSIPTYSIFIYFLGVYYGYCTNTLFNVFNFKSFNFKLLVLSFIMLTLFNTNYSLILFIFFICFIINIKSNE